MQHEGSELFYGSGVAITLVAAGAIVLLSPHALPVWAVGGLMVATGTVIGVLVRRRAIRQIPKLAKGIAGELDVASCLRRIERLGCHVIHDVPSQREDGANADHVVVAPVGVFVLETKYRSKRDDEQIRYDGSSIRIGNRPPETRAIGQAAATARELSERINRHVQAVVVFPGWYVTSTARWTNHQVWVVNPDYFAKWLESESKSSVQPNIDVHDIAKAIERFAR